MEIKSEDEYKEELEKDFFSHFFDSGWEPVNGKTKEVNIRKDTNKSNRSWFRIFVRNII